MLCIVKIDNRAPFVDIMDSVFNRSIQAVVLFSLFENSQFDMHWMWILSRSEPSQATFPLKIHTRDLYVREHNVFAIEPCVRCAVCEFLQERRKKAKCL